MKINLLSFSQMCRKRYKLTFHEKGHEIKKGSSGRLIVQGTRTDGNIYHLKKAKGSSCLMAQRSEYWFWHKSMGHINFDNMVKISYTHVVRDMPKIKNPTNTLCKKYHMGNQTMTRLKNKEYSTTKPLKLIHTNLCKCTWTRGWNGERYFMLLVDDYSRTTWVTFLKQK